MYIWATNLLTDNNEKFIFSYEVLVFVCVLVLLGYYSNYESIGIHNLLHNVVIFRITLEVVGNKLRYFKKQI